MNVIFNEKNIVYQKPIIEYTHLVKYERFDNELNQWILDGHRVTLNQIAKQYDFIMTLQKNGNLRNVKIENI